MLSFRKKLKIFILLAAAIALIVFLNNISGRSVVKNTLLKITSPFSRSALASFDYLFSLFGTLSGIKNLSVENADLKNENRNLRAELERYKELSGENEGLRAQLGVAGRREHSLLSVDIVSYDPINLSHSLIINRGAKSGLAEGMPVIIPGNILLGKIFKAYDDFSSVVLISEKDNKVSARSERGDASGVLGGSVGGFLLMDLIEKKSDIAVDDLVLTSGLDGTYPRGLIVGKVARVSMNEEGIFKQAYVAASYSGFKSIGAFVILK